MLIWNESLTEQIELDTCDWENGYTDIKEKTVSNILFIKFLRLLKESNL